MAKPNKAAVTGMEAISREDLRRLSQLFGLAIGDADLDEVAVRLGAVLEELEKLNQFDLSGAEPIPMFLPTGED